jgi:hypothetical protein
MLTLQPPEFFGLAGMAVLGGADGVAEHASIPSREVGLRFALERLAACRPPPSGADVGATPLRRTLSAAQPRVQGEQRNEKREIRRRVFGLPVLKSERNEVR